jgi:hypothetical protein
MRADDVRALYEYHYWVNGSIRASLARVSQAQFVALAAVPRGNLRVPLVICFGPR